MSAGQLTFTRLARALGAQVEGVDLRNPLDDDTFESIRKGLLDHQVLFFRDQDLTDEQHLALAVRFGEPNVYPIAVAAGGADPMTFIEDTAERPPVSDNWHTDLTWAANPPTTALLSARDIPEFGGDTLWASLYALYDALSPEMQHICATLRVTHAPEATFWSAARAQLDPDAVARLEADYPPVEHPLVTRHPDTQRPVLYISGEAFMERGIVGMYESESQLLLDHFRALLNDPNHYVRWRWRPNDLAIWDERCTNHRALSDHYPQHRLMRRCTVGAQRQLALTSP